MKSKLFLCAALAAALYVTPSYAADYSAQVVSFSQEDPDNLSIELTGSKVNYRRFFIQTSISGIFETHHGSERGFLRGI